MVSATSDGLLDMVAGVQQKGPCVEHLATHHWRIGVSPGHRCHPEITGGLLTCWFSPGETVKLNEFLKITLQREWKQSQDESSSFGASLGWGCVNSDPSAGPAQEPRSHLKPEAPAEKASGLSGPGWALAGRPVWHGARRPFHTHWARKKAGWMTLPTPKGRKQGGADQVGIVGG